MTLTVSGKKQRYNFNYNIPNEESRKNSQSAENNNARFFFFVSLTDELNIYVQNVIYDLITHASVNTAVKAQIKILRDEY